LAKGRTYRKAFLFLLGLALSGCAVPALRTDSQKPQVDSELTLVSGSTNRVLTSLQISQALPKAKVAVNDPVYGKSKHYEGFWLEDVLKLAGMRLDGENVLVFTSLDGYQARLSRLGLLRAKPLLAVRDFDYPMGWEVITHGKEKLTPGPYYLVWQTSAGSKEPGLPWPYQINRLEVRNAAESQRQLLPKGADARPDVLRGFSLFMKSCISCHSVNLEGGVLGPELNIPKNITEYRDRGYLVEFIKDPSSFRAKSKMPAFNTSLSNEKIEDILSYLDWMRDHKVLAGN